MDAENNQVPKQDFDRWLDAALRARVAAEPSTGVEQRVLARLAKEPTRRNSIWRLSFVAIAALMMIAFGIILMRTGKSTPTVLTRSLPSQNQPENKSKPAVQAIAGPRETRRQRTRPKETHCCTVLVSRSIDNSNPLPKLAVFPAPRRETEQEHLLFHLAELQGSFETASLNPDLPIRELSIPELKIAPMEGTPPDSSPQR